MIFIGKFSSEGYKGDTAYVNVTNTSSAAKPTFQLPVVKTSDETDRCKQHTKSLKSPPPTATKPK